MEDTIQNQEQEAVAIAQPEQAASRIRYTRPNYQVTKKVDAYEVRIEVPGCRKEDVEVSFDRDILSIRAERSDVLPASWTPIYDEIDRPSYLLRLNVSGPFDPAPLEATADLGILTLRLPFMPEAKPRKIEVR